MPFDFAGKRVVVTGASRGIGRAIARAVRGANILVRAGQPDFVALSAGWLWTTVSRGEQDLVSVTGRSG